MSLEESDLFKDQLEKDARRKKIIIIIFFLMIPVIVVILFVVKQFMYTENHTKRLYVNKNNLGDSVKYVALSKYEIYNELTSKYEWKESELPEIEDSVEYIDIKELSNAIGYNYSVGEYKSFKGDNEYITLDNGYEIITFKSGDRYYRKYLNINAFSEKKDFAGIKDVSFKNNPDSYVENLKFKSPPIIVGDAMYVAIDDISTMCSINTDWSGEYWKYITTLDYMVKGLKLPKGYSKISTYYEDLRAVVDGYVVVGNGTKKNKSVEFGVYKLSDYDKAFIDVKYVDVFYQQSTKQFYLTNSVGRVGIAIDNGGNSAKTIVEPRDYTNIALIDEEHHLYKVEQNEKYGVLQIDSEIHEIVPPEYDEIGYNYKDVYTDEIGTEYLWYDKYIPVKRNNRVGLFKVGNPDKGLLQVLSTSFSDFGYISEEIQVEGKEESILVVPGSEGVYGLVISRLGAYGLYDLNAEKITLPCIYEKFFAITENGKRTYYCEYSGEKYELSDYFANIDGKGTSIKNVDESGNYIDGDSQNNEDNNDNDSQSDEDTENEEQRSEEEENNE